jgi:hypothetical protein
VTESLVGPGVSKHAQDGTDGRVLGACFVLAAPVGPGAGGIQTAAVVLQPAIPKSDRLPHHGINMSQDCTEPVWPSCRQAWCPSPTRRAASQRNGNAHPWRGLSWGISWYPDCPLASAVPAAEQDRARVQPWDGRSRQFLQTVREVSRTLYNPNSRWPGPHPLSNLQRDRMNPQQPALTRRP